MKSRSVETTLVTGGCGFLGWHIARRLARDGRHVLCYDLREPNSGLAEVQTERLEIHRGDVTRAAALEDLVRSRQVREIVHAAARVGYPRKAGAIRDFVATNVGGTLNVLEAARRAQVRRVVFISSEEVYGTFQEEPAGETHPTDPCGVYAATKCAAEFLCRLYEIEHQVTSLILRTCWVYGPGLPWDRVPWNLIHQVVEGRTARLNAGWDQRSDMTYVDDLVEGVVQALNVRMPHHRIFNIASGRAASVGEMVELIRRLIPGAQLHVGPGLLGNSDRVKMPQKGALDISRAEAELGYRPRYSLDAGLGTYISWLQDHNHQ